MAYDIGSSSDLSDLESSYNPPPSKRLSYEEIVAGIEYKDVKDKIQSTLVSPNTTVFCSTLEDSIKLLAYSSVLV